MANIGKLKIGRKSKKEYFDFTHDVNTTFDFGFSQPTLIDLVPAGSNVSLKTKEFVRLAPLPTPTFGRVKVHTDTSFVPLKDVYPAFGHLMDHTSLTSRKSYIPDSLDFMESKDIVTCLFALSNLYGKMGMFDKCPLRYSIYWNVPLTPDEYDFKGNVPYRDIMNDASVVTGHGAQTTAFNILWNLTSFPSTKVGPLYTKLFSLFGSVPVNYDAATGSAEATLYPNILNFLTDVPERKYWDNDALPTNYTFPYNADTRFGYLGKWEAGNFSSIFDTVERNEDELKSPITLDNADYYFTLDMSNFSVQLYSDSDEAVGSTFKISDKAYFCIKLTRVGRRLMRVFRAMRKDPFGRYSKKIPLAPLFAYYKAWFDIYNPGRTHNWQSTNAYSLIHLYYDYNVITSTWLRYSDVTSIGGEASATVARQWLFNFFLDLSKCCYVLPVDNVTVCTNDYIENVQSDINRVSVYFDDSGDTSSVGVSDNTPYGSNGDSIIDNAGGLGIKMLERAYAWTNKNSVLGQMAEKIAKRFNIELRDGSILDRSSYMCDISDVFSTAETDLGFLGEYAGKGLGSGEIHASLKETKDYGYIIQTISISPHAGYVQGDGVHPLRRMDFLQPEFDSMGNEPVGMSEVFNRHYNLDGMEADFVFGYRPRYMGLKVRNNIANGYFAERSSQSQYLPYSLDRLFSTEKLVYTRNGHYINSEPEYRPYAGEDIRFVGLNESLGNYDRIFYETDGLVDNFIMHILQEYKVWSPMKPVSESFDTFDKDVDDDVFESEHA